MPQGNDFSPLDAGEIITGTFDYGRWLPTGVTIASVSSVACTAHKGTDASASGRLVGAASIGASPLTGAASAAVTQKWGNMVAGVTYRLTAKIVTSDSQTLILWAHQRCQEPN